MYYTKYLPLLLLALTGCATVTNHGPAPQSGADSLGASADNETDLYRQAITELNNSQLEQAETDLITIARAHPELAGPWVNLALIDIKKNNLESASKNLAKALDKNPKMPQAYNLLGFIETSKGNINKAVGDYRQAITFKQDYALAHYNLALLNDIYLQDIKVAIDHYKRYLELTGYQDKKTADWVQELERNLKRDAQ